MVCYKRRLFFFAVFEFYNDWFFRVGSACSEFFELSPFSPCSFESGLEAFGEECEDIKYCGFSATVWSEENGVGFYVFEFQITDNPVIFDGQTFYLRDGGGFHVRYV